MKVSPSINRALFILISFVNYAHLDEDDNIDSSNHFPPYITRPTPSDSSHEIEIHILSDADDDAEADQQQPGLLKYLNTFRYPQRKRYLTLNIKRGGNNRRQGPQLLRPMMKQNVLPPAEEQPTTPHPGTLPHTATGGVETSATGHAEPITLPGSATPHSGATPVITEPGPQSNHTIPGITDGNQTEHPVGSVTTPIITQPNQTVVIGTTGETSSQTQHSSGVTTPSIGNATTPASGQNSTQIVTSVITSSGAPGSSTIKQYSPSSPIDASASFVVATLPSVSDADKLENWPTSMELISRIISTQLLGYVAGYVQVDKCAFELLETCTPSNGSATCSVEECTARCNSLEKCRRITFAEDGLCRLETRSCQRQLPVGSSNSFIKVSNAYVQFPGNCPDNFIMDYGLENDQRVGCSRCSIEDCRFACDMLPLCVGFSFAQSAESLESHNKQCYIKQDVCTHPINGTHIFYQKLPLYA